MVVKKWKAMIGKQIVIFDPLSPPPPIMTTKE
jgi:hypothetical protein